jgi:hypothetical protein
MRNTGYFISNYIMFNDVKMSFSNKCEKSTIVEIQMVREEQMDSL